MAFYLGGFQPISYIDAITGKPFFVAGGHTFQPSYFYHPQQHMYPGSYIGSDGRLVVNPDVYRAVQQQMKFDSTVFKLHQKLHGEDKQTSISSGSQQSRVYASSGSHSTTEKPIREMSDAEKYDASGFK